MADLQRTKSSVLKMVEIDGKGRGLVTSQPLKAGEILMEDTPIYAYFVSPLKQEQQDTQSCTSFCAHCYRSLASSSPPLTCPSCCSLSIDTVFCSSKCLSVSLTSTHTPWVCQTLNSLRNCSLLVDNPNPNQEIQIQARCVVAVFNLAMVSPSKFQAFLSLDGCGARDGEEGYVKGATFLHSVFSSSVPFPEMSTFSLPSAEIIADILAKDWRNCFCLMEPFSERRENPRSVRGYGLYLNASLFNHSCLPNACHFNYLDAQNGNTNRIVRLMQDVGFGDEICISYLRANLSYSERQRRLMNDYTFACVCERCKVEANSNSDPSLVCSVKRLICMSGNCRGFMAPLPPSIDGCPSEFVECNLCGNLTNRQDK